jgi:signal transduction histidine kinase
MREDVPATTRHQETTRTNMVAHMIHRTDRWPSRVVIVVVIVAPIILVAAFNVLKSYRDFTTMTVSQRHMIASLAATTLHEKFARLTAIGVALATRVQFRHLIEAGHWAEAVDIFRRVPQDFPFIERVFLADPRGTLMADTPAIPGVRGVNFASRDWYQGVSRTWQPYVSDAYQRAAAPRYHVIAAAIPITTDQDLIAGILVLQVHLQSLLEWMHTIELGPAGVVSLVDRQGQLAAHPQLMPEGEMRDVSSVPAVQKVLRGECGVHIAFDPVAQEARVVAYAPVPGYGWGVMVEQPTRTAFAARDQQLRRLGLAYGLVVLASGTFAYWLLRTLTERRRAARQINALNADLQRWAADLEAANKELEAFNYAVSHDLRMPLTSIDGFSQALLEHYTDTLDAQGQDYLQRIHRATQRMADLIDALLALSQVTRAALLREAVDVSALAQAMAADLQRREPTRQVEFIIADGLVASGDTRLLGIVLENLFSNAWKFTARQPWARIEFGGLPPQHGGAPVFFVRDNGVGFDMADADKLFRAFQRLHGRTEYPGTGIGLATVQRIVQRHGGRIWAEGAVGQGATFYFTL